MRKRTNYKIKVRNFKITHERNKIKNKSFALLSVALSIGSVMTVINVM